MILHIASRPNTSSLIPGPGQNLIPVGLCTQSLHLLATYGLNRQRNRQTNTAPAGYSCHQQTNRQTLQLLAPHVPNIQTHKQTNTGPADCSCHQQTNRQTLQLLAAHVPNPIDRHTNRQTLHLLAAHVPIRHVSESEYLPQRDPITPDVTG